MIINKAILHILDFNNGTAVLSQREIAISNEWIGSFLDHHLERVFHDENQKCGEFLPESKFRANLQQYQNGAFDFLTLSAQIAQNLYENLQGAEIPASIDVLVLEFNGDDARYFGVLLLENKTVFSHRVEHDGDALSNELIRYHSALPGTGQKIDEYLLVDLEKYVIKFANKRRLIEGNQVYVLQDKLLECTSELSPKETVHKVNNIVKKIAETHGSNSAMAVSKAKNCLTEVVERSEDFVPMEIGRSVFRDEPALQAEFENKVRAAKLPETIKVEKSYAVRAGGSHRIKTDTGIEITFPADYFENREFMEFTNNPDGTISIQIKNVGKIINK